MARLFILGSVLVFCVFLVCCCLVVSASAINFTVLISHVTTVHHRQWLRVKQNTERISKKIFQNNFISRATMSETETKLFQPWKGF